ncbi:hypothetical protein QBC39DRAFT_249894 [Podospora conica]|nr:hypothetical protein QBC39DRAFT_249894 [Schizothecium conicum]
MDAAGMKSWANVLSGNTATLPNLSAYAGPAKKNNRRNRNRKNKNGQAPTPAAQPLSGMDIPRSETPGSDTQLGFRYNRDWISFGAARKEIGDLLDREIKRQNRAGLPPLYIDIAEENLEPLRQVYQNAGELALYHKRLDIRRSGQPRQPYPASYVFQVGHIATTPLANLNTENPLVQFLRRPEFAMRVLNHLKPSMRDIMSLATTCREASVWVAGNMEVWDARKLKLRDLADEIHFMGEEDCGLRSHIVVVTPTESGLPVTPTPYFSDFIVMERLLTRFMYTRMSFQDLVLDKIPFLDCKILNMIFGSMKNLKTMSISNCPLMDFTKLKPLLDIIARHPTNSEDGGKMYVKVDFQPFFFNGLNGRDTSKSPGSFGVTHNPPTFNIPKAAFGLIMKCLSLAKKVGMDLLSEGSSIWRFLRRLPGPDILWATKARDAIAVYEAALKSGPMSFRALKAAKNAFADDIMAALSGDGVEPIEVPWRFDAPSRGLSFNYGYWRGEKKCVTCDMMLLRAFFPIHTKECWPCKMDRFVDTAECSHMRHRLQALIDFWAEGLEVNEDSNLRDLLDESRWDEEWNAQLAAEDLDYAWFHQLAYTTGPRGEQPAWPEPSNARPDAVSFRRSLMLRRKVFPKGDYREGGPQFEHPALAPIYPEMQTSPRTHGCEPYEHFCATWMYSDKSDVIMANFFREAHPDADEDRVQRYLEGARESTNQIHKARELEWIALNEANAIWYTTAMADVEDCVISRIGPGPRSWNRDQVKNAERALEPMDLFGHYMGKNNFQL